MLVTALWLERPWSLLQWSVVICAALAGTFTDLRTRRIPNWLTLPVLAGGLVFAGWAAGWRGVGDGVLGMLVAGVPFLVPFILGGGGAGDAKLMAALGAWLGIINAVVLLGAVLLAGGVLGLGYAAWQGRLRRVVGNVRNMMLGVWVGVVGRSNPRDLMPGNEQMLQVLYGAAIFSGACVAAGGVYLWRR